MSLGGTSDGEGMNFSPAPVAHAHGEDADTDVLTGTPATVEAGDLNTS